MRRRVASSACAHFGLEDIGGQLAREIFVALLFLGEIAEQAAHADILGLFGGFRIELLGLLLHGLDFLADDVERQVLHQPDRTAAKEALDVLAADRRQVLAEALLVGLEQAMAVAALFLGHLLEDLRGVRITLPEVFGEGHVDAAVFLFGSDRDRQHLALAEFGEIFHGGPSVSI